MLAGNFLAVLRGQVDIGGELGAVASNDRHIFSGQDVKNYLALPAARFLCEQRRGGNGAEAKKDDASHGSAPYVSPTRWRPKRSEAPPRGRVVWPHFFN